VIVHRRQFKTTQSTKSQRALQTHKLLHKMNYFRRQSNNTTCILLIKVYTQSNKSIPLINKAAVIQPNTTNELTLKSLLRSEISSAQQSSQSEGINKNKRRTISITNNSVEVQTIEGTNINALLDLPICNLFDVLNRQHQRQHSSSERSSSYEIIVIVKGHDNDIDNTNEAVRRNSSSSTNIRKQNASPRIVRILIILAFLAIISEIFVPNTTISSTNVSDASFATPTTTNQHHKSSQTNHIPTSTNNNPNANLNNKANANVNNSLGNKRRVQIEQCTPSELKLILYQLPNDDCYTYKKQPWRQKCSLTYATKCPGMFVGLLCFCLFVCLFVWLVCCWFVCLFVLMCCVWFGLDIGFRGMVLIRKV